ncbi:MAG: DUF2851 family protein [Tannerella sp.]|jgi:hypothetical protein|nr:DUF2851 family protein [Tannerella sp.]
MEHLLQYVWKYRLYSGAGLLTTEGVPVTVLDPGIQNTDSGPDFFNAKIGMNGVVWAGNIEIHHKASDWFRHKHDLNPAYDSVILHIVQENDAAVCRTNGELIPQAFIKVPLKIKEHIDWLLSKESLLPCASRLHEIDPIHLSAWMTALLAERLERKTNDIFMRLAKNAEDWNEVFYITLVRNFGFGTNNDAFEWLAQSLPFKYIQKQKGSGIQIEALLFGQAGLLEEAHEDSYYQLLQREYRFLRKKYDLTPLDSFLFKKLRNRPVNFPHIRLAQLAAVWINNTALFSKILENDQPEVLKKCFDVPLSTYWDTHYHFQYASPAETKKSIGKNATSVVLINTVIPLLFAYGKKKHRDDCCMKALQMLEHLPPEQNSIVRNFAEAGLKAKDACMSQALIQLRREYCEKKKCLYCRIGFHLIKTEERKNHPGL